MAIAVEVSLRIPNVKNPAMDENGYPIDHGSVRFTKMIVVAAIPKPGVMLVLTTVSGTTFEAEVVRSDWHESRSLFILACRYAKRSIQPHEYVALIDDPEWRMRPLV